ncbi:MAG: hypothetical protein QOF76_2679 [Solirubrobacteraceae bacterium]|jgi:hypothetical protein|nr:hypothetical protein [Solirubrobacteraceae bacterium]
MIITGGAWIFLAAVLILTIGLIYGLYTRLGSGINAHAYRGSTADKLRNERLSDITSVRATR